MPDITKKKKATSVEKKKRPTARQKRVTAGKSKAYKRDK